jgi:hypothetical protein
MKKKRDKYELKNMDGWDAYEGGRFEEGYRFLRAATNFDPGPCFVGAWMSLSKDDRGEKLSTWPKLAAWLCIARQTCYNWRAQFELDEWAELLRLMELRGEKLGDVDRVTYLQAIDSDAPVDARRLYYQRAGVMGQEITVHDKTQKERLTDWLIELRALEQDA